MRQPQPNKNGVYDKADSIRHEVIEGNYWAKLFVIELSPGQWSWAYDVRLPESGISGPLTKARSVASRQEAEDQGWAFIVAYLERDANGIYGSETKSVDIAKKLLSGVARKRSQFDLFVGD